MAQKSVINACFGLFFVALVVAAAVVQSSCIKDARETLEQNKGRPLPGGHTVIEKPQEDCVVKGIVASALKQYNRQLNKSRQFELYEDGKLEAYKQVILRLTVSPNCKV